MKRAVGISAFLISLLTLPAVFAQLGDGLAGISTSLVSLFAVAIVLIVIDIILLFLCKYLGVSVKWSTFGIAFIAAFFILAFVNAEITIDPEIYGLFSVLFLGGLIICILLAVREFVGGLSRNEILDRLKWKHRRKEVGKHSRSGRRIKEILVAEDKEGKIEKERIKTAVQLILLLSKHPEWMKKLSRETGIDMAKFVEDAKKETFQAYEDAKSEDILLGVVGDLGETMVGGPGEHKRRVEKSIREAIEGEEGQRKAMEERLLPGLGKIITVSRTYLEQLKETEEGEIVKEFELFLKKLEKFYIETKKSAEDAGLKVQATEDLAFVIKKEAKKGRAEAGEAEALAKKGERLLLEQQAGQIPEEKAKEAEEEEKEFLAEESKDIPELKEIVKESEEEFEVDEKAIKKKSKKVAKKPQ